MKRAKPRAAIILVSQGQIALLERHRAGRHYFVFPGGGVDKNETPPEAAAREAHEELGLQVSVGRMVAEVWYNGLPQYYFLAQVIDGSFGAGHGKEMGSLAESEQGSYLPCWIPVADLLHLPVLPTVVARYVYEAIQEGWPEHPLCIRQAIVD